MGALRVPKQDLFQLTGLAIGGDKYQVDAVVGGNSYALVYRAVHIPTQEAVALQVFSTLGEYGLDVRQRLLSSFMHQGTRLRGLVGLATAIRAPRDMGRLTLPDKKWVPFMVFDWLEGVALKNLLMSERSSGAAPRTLGAAMSVLDPVAVALEVLHSDNLVHLDVRPSNVFLPKTTEGHPEPSARLLDFGTANLISHAFDTPGSTESVSIAPSYFTPAYAAPEQLVSPGAPVGPWTDLFSLAICLVEMISGKAPDEGGGELATAPRPTPRRLGMQVSDAADAVFARALSIDPRQRYQTIREFWSAARRMVEAPEAPPPSLSQPRLRSPRQEVSAPHVASTPVAARPVAHVAPVVSAPPVASSRPPPPAHAPPVAPAPPVASALPVSRTQPVASALPVAPPQPVASALPSAPPPPVVRAPPVAPPPPVAPAPPVASALPVALAPPVASAPLVAPTPPVRTVAVAPAPPMVAPRSKVDTSPDLIRAKLEAAELRQRTPRLVIVVVTLALIAIAMGVLLMRAPPPQQPVKPHDTAQGGH